MTDPRTPTSDPVAAATEAGRRAEYELCHFNTCAGMRGPNDCDCGVARAILAIEAEARQQARAAFAAQVAALRDVNPTPTVGTGTVTDWPMVRRADVLALAASPEPASPEAPGSGLDLEALATALWTVLYPDPAAREALLNVRGIAEEYDRLAARPDGAEADAS